MSTVHTRKFHYIYKITRFDGAFYIGMHSTNDLEDGYFGSGQRLWKSIKYHGKDKHSMEILEFLPTRKELVAREKQIVNEDLLQDKRCLNLCTGGGYARRAPDDPNGAVQKSAALKAYYASEAGQVTKQKLSEIHTGRKRTEETKENMSVAAKERMSRMQADGSWEEVKRKNAEAHKGKKQSAKTIVKRNQAIAAHKEKNGGKRTFSDEARLNISKSLIGSARNVKSWKLMGADGSLLEITNLQRWVRDNGFKCSGVVIRDPRGNIIYRIKK